MIVISHRGYWKTLEEKNSEAAFVRSFALNLGTETDLRDYNGRLVISHDIPNDSSISFERMLEIYLQYSTTEPPLALNVKADGLQIKAKEILNRYNIKNYFFFDMAIPDTLGYFDHNLRSFLRLSEYENFNDLYLQAAGIWLDGFQRDIVNEKLLEKILVDGKQVCIVSPELHKRSHMDSWAKYKSFSKHIVDSHDLIICTDYPEQCVEFFNGE